jgi:DNA-binding transcriptional LysR family regulator
VDRLTSTTVFARVAATSSFSAAARELGMSQATASKHVQMLEAWLGCRLLHRTTRRVGLTETGENFYAQCTRILEDMDAALQSGKPDARLRGSLRISAPVAFGSTRLGALVVEFLEQNCDLSLSVILCDRPVDVIEEGYDFAIRVKHDEFDVVEQPGLVSQPLASLRFMLCAAPEYLAREGTPERPADLAKHTCLTDTRHPGDIWRFSGPDGPIDVPVAGRLKTDNGMLRRSAARAGAGILLAADFLVADDIASGRLVEVLADHRPSCASLDAVCPAHRAASPKVRALIAFLRARLAVDKAAAGLPGHAGQSVIAEDVNHATKGESVIVGSAIAEDEDAIAEGVTHSAGRKD